MSVDDRREGAISVQAVLYWTTFAAIGPLLIEQDWLVRGGMLAFLAGLVYLLWRAPKTAFNSLEKGWTGIVLFYVGVFLLSFLLRPPYEQDGIWRLSAPGLMLLVLLWFTAVVHQQMGWVAAKAVAVGILAWGVIVAVWEVWAWHPDVVSSAYKLGMYVSDLGAVGGIIPLGAGLALAVAVHERRSWRWWLLALVGLILVLLLKKRTPMVMYGTMLAVWAGWLFLRHGGLAIWQRIMLVFAVVAVLGVGAWLQRDLVQAAWRDYTAAVEQGNFVTSLGLRYKMLQLGARLIEEKPLTGWGPNAYKSEGLWPLLEKEQMDPRARDLIAHFTHLHNQFVMDWVLSGILGLISVIALLVYPVYLVWRHLRDRWECGVLLAGLGIGLIVVMQFGALFTYTYTTTAIMLTLSAMVAIAARRHAHD